jgi:hypothetical protein
MQAPGVDQQCLQIFTPDFLLFFATVTWCMLMCVILYTIICVLMPMLSKVTNFSVHAVVQLKTKGIISHTCRAVVLFTKNLATEVKNLSLPYTQVHAAMP